MPALAIFHITINDPKAYAEYAKHTPRIISEFGGRVIVRGGEPELLEGPVIGTRVVVIEFPDRAAAKVFYQSAAYQKIIGIRQAASVASGVIVDTFDASAWVDAVAESKKHG